MVNCEIQKSIGRGGYNEKKKIAMVLDTEPFCGGGHQYALQIAQCLQELPASEYELVALGKNRFWRKWCRENHINYFKLGGSDQGPKQMIRNRRFPSFYTIYNTYKTELGKIVRKEKIDVLFATTPMYLPKVNAKVIMPVHDLMHRYEPSFPEVKSEYQGRELVYKFQAKCADYILTDSKLGKKQFIESYFEKSKKKPHIVVLPYTVPDHIAGVNEECIEVPERYVFYPAQFWQHKNHINLIKAIQNLKKDINEIHLVLVGSEKNYGKEIEKYIIQNGLENNITIMGFVSNEGITYLYRHAVGMIMPSYFGPTNIPPLEAMALGCPVAVSNKYAMPEQVGEAGLLFNPDSPEEIADCIKRLWTDEKLREQMIKKGYRRVQSWTGEDFKNRVLKVVDKCCGED